MRWAIRRARRSRESTLGAPCPVILSQSARRSSKLSAAMRASSVSRVSAASVSTCHRDRALFIDSRRQSRRRARHDPVDRAALLRARAFGRIAALAQSGQSGARRVRQPSGGRRQLLHASALLAAKKRDHLGKLAALSRDAQFGSRRRRGLRGRRIRNGGSRWSLTIDIIRFTIVVTLDRFPPELGDDQRAGPSLLVTPPHWHVGLGPHLSNEPL